MASGSARKGVKRKTSVTKAAIGKTPIRKAPIRKNDQVYVLQGRDRGKTGRVLVVLPDQGRVVVEGVQMIKRHTRPNPQKNIKGGIVEKESPIDISNVALVCRNCNKRTRVGMTVLDASLKPRRVERTCRKCGNSLD